MTAGHGWCSLTEIAGRNSVKKKDTVAIYFNSTIETISTKFLNSQLISLSKKLVFGNAAVLREFHGEQ